MYDFVVLMPTYNRLSSAKKISQQLRGEVEVRDFSVAHVVIDDCSEREAYPYKEAVESWSKGRYRTFYHRNPKNFGRFGYWKTWNRFFAIIQAMEFKYAIAIPDDHDLCQDFLLRTSAYFDRINKLQNPKVVCVNLLVNSLRNWGHTKFIDCAFIATRKFFDVLSWKLSPVPVSWFENVKNKNAAISSGVGHQMTERLSRCKKYTIAKVRNVSFLRPMSTPSVMFPPGKFPFRPAFWGKDNFVDKGLELRFGLIGDGRIAERHKEAIEAIGGTLSAVYDPKWAESIKKNDGTFHNIVSQIDGNFFDLVDWVVVCSPTYTHHKYVRLALAHRKKVICEKPYMLPWQPVIDSDDVYVVLQLQWLSLPEQAKVIKVTAARNDQYFTGWKGEPKLTGGLFFDLFIHYIDLAWRYKCTFEGRIISHGKQERWIDDFNLMSVDMESAYVEMYKDIVFRGKGVHPEYIAKLHWFLGRYTERFGAGKEMLYKKVIVKPSEYI